MKTNHSVTSALLLVLLCTGITFAAPQKSEHGEAQALFKQHCAMCHGPDGKGQTPMGKKFNIPDLQSPTVQHKSAADLTQIIENGKQKMPAFKSQLKPEQTKDLVGYIHHLGK